MFGISCLRNPSGLELPSYSFWLTITSCYRPFSSFPIENFTDPAIYTLCATKATSTISPCLRLHAVYKDGGAFLVSQTHEGKRLGLLIPQFDFSGKDARQAPWLPPAIGRFRLLSEHARQPVKAMVLGGCLCLVLASRAPSQDRCMWDFWGQDFSNLDLTRLLIVLKSCSSRSGKRAWIMVAEAQTSHLVYMQSTVGVSHSGSHHNSDHHRVSQVARRTKVKIISTTVRSKTFEE